MNCQVVSLSFPCGPDIVFAWHFESVLNATPLLRRNSSEYGLRCLQIYVQATMYGEPEYHGAYAASNSEASNGMHRSPSQCESNYHPADACHMC